MKRFPTPVLYGILSFGEKCDSISRLRRRKRPAENSAGRPRYTDNGGKMPAGIFDCAAGRRWQRIRPGGAKVSCLHISSENAADFHRRQ